MPTPAAESPEAFASPVPTQTVFPVGSFGSTVIELTAWIPKEPERNSQFGWP